MNLKLKSIFCIAVLLFCGVTAIQAQEIYVSQSDVDNYIANFDKIASKDLLGEAIQSLNSNEVPSMVMQIDFLMEPMMMMIESEDERQILMEEMVNEPVFSEFFDLKESIHPDDLNLLNENFDPLSELMLIM